MLSITANGDFCIEIYSFYCNIFVFAKVNFIPIMSDWGYLAFNEGYY
ncbi:hypothetical protein LDG_8561 [Legionella drancourtii LLAP12]|uniref:Uncharacterized protein n=1 Tax=Legionella drancourtii LLAP12 TaxID=658187 RepID=G9ETD0_9GAMM|nr:hypothetical protein LDG_8561 [Legionella drancourtii LLAP12]